MNLNQLEYFVAAADTLNFTKAAERCYISQTAMTQQIRALEKTIGTPLFIRDKHHVELTLAGKVFLNEANAILSRSSDAIRMARLASEGVSGSITIGYIKGFGQSDFSDILRSFSHTFPNITLKLIGANSSILREKLEDGECDLIFSLSNASDEKEILSHQYLRSYPVMVVLSKDHLLAEKKHLFYKDLQDEHFIMMQPASRPKDQMEESMLIYRRGGYLPHVVNAEGDPEALLLMISAGMGISLLPEYITRHYANDPYLAIIPLLKEDGSAETLDVEVIWRKENVHPAVLNLIGLLK